MTISSNIEPDFKAANPATANLMQLAGAGGPFLALGLIGSTLLGLASWGVHAVIPNIPEVGFGPAVFFMAVLVLYFTAQSLIASALLSAMGVYGEVLEATSTNVEGISSDDYQKFLSLR
ncbi:putative polIII-like exoribonuclease [Caulobacter phage C1]|nr:putative polIII-like exoribonuclease [Caulobacter phage C1]UTU08406.1 putative PolIII-like exoribonuclease [Caulobacter phage C2]UTU08923.1 putative polIII-like exoribonuclease [Caulobacter phage J4]UTU09479.1 putative polIII-like exoribonuclease [Caulobacter phage BL47]UTU10039.1 putative polIII-like exoribonuclease [Caulobacter phage RB23]WGN97074.1 putative polllll-like exoribonuclease [Bertelyvirus sp.]